MGQLSYCTAPIHFTNVWQENIPLGGISAQLYLQVLQTSGNIQGYAMYLWPLVQKRVPYLEEYVADHTIYKHNKEPVEGDERVVHSVLLKVGMQPREFLTHQVLEDSLVNLKECKTKENSFRQKWNKRYNLF